MFLFIVQKLDLNLFWLVLLSSVSIAGFANAQTEPNEQPRPEQDSITPVFSGQKVRDEVVVPRGRGEVITDIAVRFVNKDGNLVEGKTKPRIITQEFELEPGNIYDADLAREGLKDVLDLIVVDRASLSLEEIESGETVMVVTIQESGNLAIGFGLTLPAPTALQGSVRPVTVPALSDAPNGFNVGVRVELLNIAGLNQGVSLGLEGGEDTFGFNLGYRKFLRSDRGIGINLFNRRGVEAEFDEGDPDINLDNDTDPVVHRFGGGIEYFFPMANDWDSAVGVSYQKVSIRDGVFSDNIESTDALGNRLTVSDSGQDEFLTLNFATVLDREDNPRNPTSGYKLLLGSDLYFPLGEADIFANRLAANYTHYLPVPLFGFTKGAKTLVLNVQGGTILGDAIPYEAFILGGSSSVRGFDTSEISTSRSFVQATAEYRYPIINLTAFKNQIDVGGTFFVDYASDLGSADAVIGQPGAVRGRTGDGLGYGLGLRTLTPIGAVRTEFALNDDGESEFIFSVGDRF